VSAAGSRTPVLPAGAAIRASPAANNLAANAAACWRGQNSAWRPAARKRYSPRVINASRNNQAENPTMRRLISSGSAFETSIGYSRAVVDGDWVFVSGTTGFNYETMTISDEVTEQAEQTLRNIGQVLAEAGSSFADVVRVHYILPDPVDFKPCWPVLRQYFGEVRPAATMLSAGLADPRMKIEIEVTALKRGR
jgi:enamine deaminase RidA (YjgF/YER057c/UK114 family)